MTKDTQISAVVSRHTKDLLDRLVRATGLKKGYVLEMALRHHLRALEELPADVILPPRLVVTRRSGEEVAGLLKPGRKPAKDLRDLMHGP